MIKTINNKRYVVSENEFHPKLAFGFENLNIVSDVGELDRIVGLLQELSALADGIHFEHVSHGGYLVLNVCNSYQSVTVHPKYQEMIDTTISASRKPPVTRDGDELIQRENDCKPIKFGNRGVTGGVTVDNHTITIGNNLTSFTKYLIKNLNWTVTVSTDFDDQFKTTMKYYLDDAGAITYDNLLHLTMIVKNAGPGFAQVLTSNLQHIDRWTILDTGSTDGTPEVIKQVLVGKKPGNLYYSEFVDFEDTRNLCLDLAYNEPFKSKCRFTIMLDDTYEMRGNFKGLLKIIREDQLANSFSFFIVSGDVEYASNRLIKTEEKLRYMFKIHEVIQDFNNVTVVIPKEYCCLFDHRSEYMETRTVVRKQKDLEWLTDLIKSQPHIPRHLYYMAQTYNCIENYEKALEYFKKRLNHENYGFQQERYDSAFEAGRIAQFRLGKPWDEVKPFYDECIKMDPKRPDAWYFLGIYYSSIGQDNDAFRYIKEAFRCGLPVHSQFSIKPALSYYYVPKFLVKMCYMQEDYKLGYEVCNYFQNNLKNITSDMIKDPPGEFESMTVQFGNWWKIFSILVALPDWKPIIRPNRDIFIFVVDGNFRSWNGSTIDTEGVGGSETFIIEVARRMVHFFDVIVFCRTDNAIIHDGVQYQPINNVLEFVRTVYVKHCMVSRFSEYLPAMYHSYVEHVYFISHDLSPTTVVVPLHPKLSKFYCLSEWHKEFTESIYKIGRYLDVLPYGIVTEPEGSSLKTINEDPKFIFSSFANRGLLEVLQVWPAITGRYPGATLDVFCDLDNEWMNTHYGEYIQKIRDLLPLHGVTNHGWVSKQVLQRYWKSADVWLYPCKFTETFCHTALEAQASKTLVITNDLGALVNTVDDRGIVIPGQVDQEWMEKALKVIFDHLENPSKNQPLIERAYDWAVKQTWDSVVDKLMDHVSQLPPYQYRNMYGWKEDLPAGSVDIMTSKLLKFRDSVGSLIPLEILEVGSYCGISLIEFLKLLPGSRGTAIDSWEQTEELKNIVTFKVEEAFDENIKGYPITKMKGKSSALMGDLKANGKLYDIIYIDGSHKCLDVYSDCVQGWSLLRPGGLFILDDCTLFWSSTDPSLWKESPYEAIYHFVQDKSHCVVNNTGYRLFMRKL